MKRITQGSSVSLNETAFESLKPLYGTRGNPPYYDPNDLHSHTWKKGKLGIEDNPKISTYAKGKLIIKDCVYCKICHIIKDSFQSTVGENRDIVTDLINVISHGEESENGNCGGGVSYIIIEPVEEKYSAEIKGVNTREKYRPEKINSRLFHTLEGIFNDYIEIETNIKFISIDK